MTFRDLKIGTRFGIGFAAILVLMAAMLTSTLWQLGRISDAKARMVATSQRAKLAQDWLYGIASNSVRNLAKVKSATKADEAYYDAQMAPVRDRIDGLQKQLTASIVSGKGQQSMRAVDAQRKHYAIVRDEALA